MSKRTETIVTFLFGFWAVLTLGVFIQLLGVQFLSVRQQGLEPAEVFNIKPLILPTIIEGSILFGYVLGIAVIVSLLAFPLWKYVIESFK